MRPDLHDRLRALDEEMDGPARRLLGDEGATAARRLLTRVVAAAPGVLTRSSRDDVAVGAVIWAVAQGNDLLGMGRVIPIRAIQEVCALRSSPSARGSAFAHAVGGGRAEGAWGGYQRRQQPDVVPLGDPGLLLASFRRQLCLRRDLALALRDRADAVPDG